jgi:DNA polymerase III epsilon subunit-like protein
MSDEKDFVVIDTEGREALSEIAIFNSRGQLIYEAFSQESFDRDVIRLNLKPLNHILVDFFRITQSKAIVCHNANHDIQVLKNSCRKAGIKWSNFLTFECSYTLAQKYFPALASYSLEYLSQKLNLQVNRKYFNSRQAHTARYDAEFTYQVYLKIMERKSIQATFQDRPNPFGSSRVDNPFQDHVDLKSIYQSEFEVLKAIITDIKGDKNHQSKGAVVIGEPGAGKTHLMMRLAKELLQINRLLFIRQPNNPDAILYHIYSRILESFVQEVLSTGYTQIQHLLAHSFVKLISTTTFISLTQKDRDILEAIADNPLNLYIGLGVEGTQRKREYWQHIEKRTNEWWLDRYGIAGYSAQIIKGIIKFCSYTDPRKKELVTRWLSANELTEKELNDIGLENWNEELSKEAFSLEAISVFSKLSLLDEPLIIVFDQLEGLGLKHNQRLLLSFGEAIKEIFTHVPNSLIILNLFPDRWQQFQDIFDGSIVDRISQYQVILQKPSQKQLQAILNLKAKAVNIQLENLFDEIELKQILTANSIRAVLNRAADYYRYKVQNIPLPRASESNDSKQSVISAVEARLKKLENRVLQFEQVFQAIQKVFNLPLDENTNPTILEPVQFASNNNIQNSDRNLVLRYLKTIQKSLEQEYNKLQIISDSDDIGKLITIVNAYTPILDLESDRLRLGKRTLPEHLVIIKNSYSYVIGFLQSDGSSFTSRIKNFNELVINYRDFKFQVWRDARQSDITGKVGKEEIEKLNNTSNGQFLIMEESDRINFELLYKLITDIQNKDLEIDLESALKIVLLILQNFWLFNTLNSP